MRALASAALGLVLLGSAPARAYDEAHLLADDVRVRVEGDGAARVEHALSLRVLAGFRHGLDLVGIEAGAQPDPSTSVTAEDGTSHAVRVEVRPGESPTLHLSFDEPKGLPRGSYRVAIGYRIDVVAARELVRDGPGWRLTWTAPRAPEGYDSAHVVFDVPIGTDEPRSVREGSDAPDDATVVELSRRGGRDELDMARPHVPRGTSEVWSAYLARDAFPALARVAAVAPAPSSSGERAPRSVAALLVVLAGLAAGYGALVLAKERALRRACKRARARALPLVAMPRVLRAVLAGSFVAAGVAFQLRGAPAAGAGLVALAMAVATHRPPRTRLEPRGPGRWLALRPDEAFTRGARSAPLEAFDPRSPRGALTLLLCFAGTLAAAFVLRRYVPAAGRFLALDTAAFLPLFATGHACQLPPGLPRSARPLRALFRRFARRRALRVAPWARIPTGGVEPDELRLLVLPRLAMPGVFGVEIGVAWARLRTQYAGAPEVLVRVREASAASARMTTLAPFAKPVPGRKPEERVYRLAPLLPTGGFTGALVERLCRELTERRAPGESPWDGDERRLPPAARAIEPRSS